MRDRALVEQEPATRSVSAAVTGPSNDKRKAALDHPSPSREAKGDPAPVTHTQEQMAAGGRYEAAEPFRSRKGDRFS